MRSFGGPGPGCPGRRAHGQSLLAKPNPYLRLDCAPVGVIPRAARHGHERPRRRRGPTSPTKGAKAGLANGAGTE
eukprot:858296-Alexandrium_andersonii.AAC.1